MLRYTIKSALIAKIEISVVSGMLNGSVLKNIPPQNVYFSHTRAGKSHNIRRSFSLA